MKSIFMLGIAVIVLIAYGLYDSIMDLYKLHKYDKRTISNGMCIFKIVMDFLTAIASLFIICISFVEDYICVIVWAIEFLLVFVRMVLGIVYLSMRYNKTKFPKQTKNDRS